MPSCGAPLFPEDNDTCGYDARTRDRLKATATVKYNGTTPTYMVIVDLGIAPGFTVDAGEFAEMVGAGKIDKFSVTSRQVTLYLGDMGDVEPGTAYTFELTVVEKK